jgi:hypothetical protein
MNRYTGIKRARNPESSRRLDPIEVAACVQMTVLISIVIQFYASIARILRGDDEFWGDRVGGTMPPTTVFAYQQSMADLAAWKVIRMGNPSIQDEVRLFLCYFEVEKQGTPWNRAIANCKTMNAFFRAVIPFCLASIADVARAVTFFGAGCFAVLDLRHWFHQLSLPRNVTHLFSFKRGHATWEWRTWPMGFRYTPVVAQTAVCSCLREAGKQMGLSYTSHEEKVPAAVMVWKNAKGDHIIVAAVWYDNIFINANSRGSRDKFVSLLRRIFGATQIHVKGEIETSEGQVEYLGVTYKIASPKVIHWKHVRRNRERWQQLRSQTAVSGRDWLERLGVINWHVRMKETPWREVRQLFSSVFAQLAPGWEVLDEPIVMPLSLHNEVDSWMAEVCADIEYTKTVKSVPTQHVFLASDASNWGAGGVLLGNGSHEVILQRAWTEREIPLHINLKETIAAVETLRAWKMRNEQPARILVAIDNVSAKSWMQGRAFPGSSVESQVFELTEECQEDVVEFILVGSEENPADEPSRDKLVKESTVQSCRAKMIKCMTQHWFEQ